MTQKINWWQIFAVLILVAGAIMTLWSAYQQDASLRTDLLTETRLAELGIGNGQVTALSGSTADLTSPDYRALKAQLERIQSTTPQARFAYLMGQRPDGTIFFYADSESPASRDYSPPGQDYSEASTGVKQIFSTGVGTTEGPFSDRWGIWVSGLVPVTDPTTGNIIAVFGMDIDAADWNMLIFRACLPMLITTLLILMLVLVFTRSQKRNEEEKRRIAESGELLREKESFQRVLLDNLTSGIVIVDAKTHIIELVNRTAAGMIKATPDQITGKKCHLFLCPADEGACPVTDQHQEIENAERVMLRSDGTTIPVLKSVKRIQISGQEKLLENFIDISVRKKAEEGLQRQTATLAILNEIIIAANKADDLPKLLESILTESLRLLDFDAGGIYLVDISSRTAKVVHSKNLPKEFLTEIFTVPIDKKPYDTLFIKNEPIITDNYETISPAHSKKFGFHSMASIPLLSKGVSIGALNFASTRRHVITDAEKQTLISISWELGSTIERMAAEEKVKKASKNLETLFNSIDEMVFVLDMQGRILVVNDTVLKRLLYTPEELTGSDVLLLHVPERRDEALRNVQGMIAGTIDSCPVPVIAKDGTRIEVETKVTRGLWNGKEVLIGVTRDVTERKVAEEEIKRQAGVIRSLLDSIPDIIFFKNMEGVYLGCNPPFAEFVGKSREEIIGKTDYDLFNKEIADFFRGHDKLMLELAQPHHNEEWITYPDGRKILIDTLKTPYWGPDGTLIGVLGISRDITERKNAEDKLLQISDRLSLAARAGGVGIWDYDVVNNTLTWDDQMFALYGITREQFGGAYDAWQAGVHPEDRKRGDEEIQQALRREKEFDTEFRVLWPDGSIRNIRALAIVQHDSDGKPLRMIGTNWDITEQKNSEEVIRESEEHIRLLLDSTAEAIYGLDINGNCTFCNNSCLQLLGYKHPDELLGKNMHWQIHHKYPDGTHFPVEECRIFKAFNKGVGTHVDDEVLWRSDGTSFHAEYWSYPQRRYGVVVGAVVTFLDITARKNAEMVLQQSEEKYRLLIKNSHDIIYTINLEGILTFVSAGWTALLGHPVTEVTGKPFQQFVHPDDIAVCLAFMQKIIDTGQRQIGVVYRVHHVDGSWRWHTSNAVPLKDDTGSVVAFEGSASDITERKHAEDAVLAANKKLNILNSVTRHDVLNQITALVMLLEIVEESVTDQETIDFVRKAEGATERINRQIDFTKEYQDIGVQAPQWQNVSDLIMSAKAQLTECPYDLLIDPSAVEIYADPLLLKVFYNLLENAIRHGENVSTVHFSSRESEDELILVYEDNGVGVDAESKKHLFQRGFGKHTGYGLYLMREILSISGITIRENGEPGMGARFEMVVPKGAWRSGGNST